MAARGYRGASLAAIAQAAGLTKPGILHHFPSKEAILLALLDQRDAELNLAVSPDADAETSIPAGWKKSPVEDILRNPDLVMLHHLLTAEGASPEHPAHDWLVRRYRFMRTVTRQTLAESERRGELAPGHDLDRLATVHLAVIEGLEAQWLAEPDSVDVEGCLSYFQSMMTALRSAQGNADRNSGGAGARPAHGSAGEVGNESDGGGGGGADGLVVHHHAMG